RGLPLRPVVAAGRMGIQSWLEISMASIPHPTRFGTSRAAASCRAGSAWRLPLLQTRHAPADRRQVHAVWRTLVGAHVRHADPVEVAILRADDAFQVEGRRAAVG
ncbi:hypothetical protein RZS08_49405, partial [Arthrospira platensis SPKY1]|nr:hypothetical protein [Arthrospira platensis SPKY1]